MVLLAYANRPASLLRGVGEDHNLANTPSPRPP